MTLKRGVVWFLNLLQKQQTLLPFQLLFLLLLLFSVLILTKQGMVASNTKYVQVISGATKVQT